MKRNLKQVVEILKETENVFEAFGAASLSPSANKLFNMFAEMEEEQFCNLLIKKENQSYHNGFSEKRTLVEEAMYLLLVHGYYYFG